MENVLGMLFNQFSPAASGRMKHYFKNVGFSSFEILGYIDPLRYVHIIRFKDLRFVQSHNRKSVKTVKDNIRADTLSRVGLEGSAINPAFLFNPLDCQFIQVQEWIRD